MLLAKRQSPDRLKQQTLREVGCDLIRKGRSHLGRTLPQQKRRCRLKISGSPRRIWCRASTICSTFTSGRFPDMKWISSASFPLLNARFSPTNVFPDPGTPVMI